MHANAPQPRVPALWSIPDEEAMTRPARARKNRRRESPSTPVRRPWLILGAAALLFGAGLKLGAAGVSWGSPPRTHSPGGRKAVRPSAIAKVAGARLSIDDPATERDGRWVEVWATAYCPNCPVCDTGWITATGRHASTAGCAVAARGERIAPLGSKVYVAGFGWLEVDDTGGGVRSDQIDVRMQSHRAARLWGRRRLRVRLSG